MVSVVCPSTVTADALTANAPATDAAHDFSSAITLCVDSAAPQPPHRVPTERWDHSMQMLMMRSCSSSLWMDEAVLLKATAEYAGHPIGADGDSASSSSMSSPPLPGSPTFPPLKPPPLPPPRT